MTDRQYYVETIAGACFCGRPATHRVMRRTNADYGARVPRPTLVGWFCEEHALAEAARREAGRGGSEGRAS